MIQSRPFSFYDVSVQAYKGLGEELETTDPDPKLTSTSAKVSEGDGRDPIRENVVGFFFSLFLFQLLFLLGYKPPLHSAYTL